MGHSFSQKVHVVTNSKGSYTGTLLRNNFHGQGKFVYHDTKETWEGEWKNGKEYNGKGVIYYETKKLYKYEGEIKYFKPNGYGTGVFCHGEVYVGEWKNNRMHGQGTYTYVNGDSWQGVWKDNQEYKGHGVIHYKKGVIYEGEIKDFKRNGYGTAVYCNGVYVGMWQDNSVHGQGKYTYENGESWQGVWKDGKKVTGHGVIQYKNEAKYSGDLKDGNYNGYGVKIYENGCIYSGEWQDNLKHGQGIYSYRNGDSWQGVWQKGKEYTGSGTIYHHNDNTKYDGEIKNGRYNGYGTRLYANGDIYTGDWRDGLRDGQATYHYANGEMYEGEWKNDQQNGQGTFCFADGSTLKGMWMNGRVDGVCVIEYKNGDKYEGESVGRYGCKHGQGKFYKDNKLFQEGHFENDKLRLGIMYIYLDDGTFRKYDHNYSLIEDDYVHCTALEDKVNALTEMIDDIQKQLQNN